MRICLVPADLSGPGSYRVLFPGRQLRLHGHEAFLPPYERIKQNGKEAVSVFSMHKWMNQLGAKQLAITMARKFLSLECDVYVFHQQANFYQPVVAQAIRDTGRLVISETDDYHLGLPWYHIAQNSPEGRTGFKDMYMGFRASNLITVSTPFLEDAYSRYGKTVLLRNYLDWDMWDDITPRYEMERKRISIGWFGHFGIRAGDLAVLTGLLGPWLEKHPEVDFVITGDNADQAHELIGTPPKQRVIQEGFKFPVGIQDALSTFDIALVPLERNNFNEAKSHLKGMEANAAGIPYIATPTQSYKDYTEEGVNGLLAQKPKDWIRALDSLLDPEVLDRMQRGARATAKRNTIQRHWGQWERVYEDHLLPKYSRLSIEAICRGALQKDEELTDLLAFLAPRRPKVVVEIGTAKGGTFWAWCRIAADDALLVSIDLPGGDYGGKLGPDVYGQRNLNLLKSHAVKDQQVEAWLLNSQFGSTRERLERLLDGRTIDFLFIDGDHSYAGVKRDFELYSPLVDGVIAFHDISHHTNMPSEVDRLWNEIKGDYDNHEFVCPLYNDIGNRGVWGGIGVIEHERVKEPA